MENTKKPYETPVVTKVEFDARERITASGCRSDYSYEVIGEPTCKD